MTKLLSMIDQRSDKTLDSTLYSYKLSGEKQHYGMDTVVSEDGEVSESEMSIILNFASGVRRDGVGDLLRIEGIDTERHRKNPLTLLDHGKHVALPIALTENPITREYSVELDTVNKEARAKCWFYQGTGMKGIDRDSENEHAKLCEQVFDLWAKKFLRSGSVGYSVIEAQHLPPDYTNGTPQGLDLRRILMLECSVVVLPASQDTIRKMLSMPTICGKSISPWLVKSLSPYLPQQAKVVTGYGTKGNRSMGTKAIPHPVRTDVCPGPDGPRTGSGRPGQRQLGNVPPEGDTTLPAPTEPDSEVNEVFNPEDVKALRLKYRKDYSTNPLESRTDYENPLSRGNVPAPKWKPGMGAVKRKKAMGMRPDEAKYRSIEQGDAPNSSLQEDKDFPGRSPEQRGRDLASDYVAGRPIDVRESAPDPKDVAELEASKQALERARQRRQSRETMKPSGGTCGMGQTSAQTGCTPAGKALELECWRCGAEGSEFKQPSHPDGGGLVCDNCYREMHNVKALRLKWRGKAQELTREQKIRLLQDRAARGEELFRPGDLPVQREPYDPDRLPQRLPTQVHYSGRRQERSLKGIKQLYKVGDEVNIVRKGGEKVPGRITAVLKDGMLKVMHLDPTSKIFEETVKQEWVRHKSISVNYRNKLIRGFADVKVEFDLTDLDLEKQHAFVSDMHGAGFSKPGRLPAKTVAFTLSISPDKLGMEDEQDAVSKAIREATKLAHRHGARFLGTQSKEPVLT